jgi:flagellar hook-basal body complex protein FliE
MMSLIDANSAVGNIVKMVRTDAGHMDSNGKTGLPVGEDRDGFGNLVADALGRVSDQQLNADNLFQKMITNPDEVEPHDVTIAMAQAEMSLNLTKAIVDRAVKAYNDITAMR